MAIEAGSELAEEIDVFVVVDIPQMRALAARHRDRERLGIDRRTGVAAGQCGAGFLVLREALRVAGVVELRGLAKGEAERRLGQA